MDRVAREPARLVRSPPGLAAALIHRNAALDGHWREAARTYGFAASPEGHLFARWSDDARDIAVFEHQVAVSRIVGQEGVLRVPEVLAHGPAWILERAIEPEPATSPAALDLVALAAERLMETAIPVAPPVHRMGGRSAAARRALRLLGGPLRLREAVMAALSTKRGFDLPNRPSHGDFHPQNVLLSGGVAWVVDWETSGIRPAGTDLLRFGLLLESSSDRGRTFEAAVAMIGAGYREELRRLRRTLLAQTIVGLITADDEFNRDPEHASRLVAILEDGLEA